MSLSTIPSSGLNLGDFHYYGVEHPFANVAHQNKWQSYSAGSYGSGSITKDSYGEVTALGGSSTARKVLFNGNGQKYPTGHYRVQYQGTGTIRLTNFSNTIYSPVSNGPGYAVFNVTSTEASGIAIEITATDALDPIKKVEVYPPFSGVDTDSHVTAVFRPTFLTGVLGEHGLARFMDWGQTNNSPQINWADRNTLDHDDWSTTAGIPYEMMVDLCNVAAIDCWICVPHQATDAYVTALATLVDGRLNAGRKIWLEYSNECWNFGFQQAVYCNTTLKTGYGLSNVWQAYGKRAGEVLHIAKGIITTNARLVCVVSGQCASSTVASYALGQSKVSGVQQADVLAVAPYFDLEGTGYNSANLYADYQAGTVNLATVFSHLLIGIAGSTTLGGATANHGIARSYGVTMVAYEGGQTLIGFGTKGLDSGFVALLETINRDSRMGDCYTALLDGWYGAGVQGRTMVLFNDINAPGRFGYWGLMDDYADTSAAKYLAVQNYYNVFASTVSMEVAAPIGLIHHWPLNETSGTAAVDLIGGNNGTYLRNATNTTYSASAPGTAITLGQSFAQASGDGVDISGASLDFLTGTNAFSISYFIKSDTNTVGRGFSNSSDSTLFGLNSSTTNYLLRDSVAADAKTFVCPVNDTNWHHLLLTVTAAGVARVFRDGVESSTGSLTIAAGDHFKPNRIATLTGAGTTEKVAWFKVFNNDQSANAVALYNERDLPIILSNSGSSTVSISIDENTTAIDTFSGTNLGSTVSYAITGDADQGSVVIDSSTGITSFLVAPNFENPTDSDINNTYVFARSVIGPGGSTTQTVTVTILNVDDFEVVLGMDTQQKRMAAISISLPWREALPIPNGLIGLADLAELVGLATGMFSVADDNNDGNAMAVTFLEHLLGMAFEFGF